LSGREHRCTLVTIALSSRSSWQQPQSEPSGQGEAVGA
jgi:hypothetical protein